MSKFPHNTILQWGFFAIVITVVVWSNNRSRWRAEEAVEITEQKLAVTPAEVQTTIIEETGAVKDVVREEISKVLIEMEHNNQLVARSDRAGMGMAMADREGKIVLWSEAASNIFGYSRKEARQLHVEDLMVSSEREGHRAAYQRGLDDDRVNTHGIQCTQAVHKDGHKLRLRLILISPANANWAMAYFSALGDGDSPEEYSHGDLTGELGVPVNPHVVNPHVPVPADAMLFSALEESHQKIDERLDQITTRLDKVDGSIKDVKLSVYGVKSAVRKIPTEPAPEKRRPFWKK